MKKKKPINRNQKKLSKIASEIMTVEEAMARAGGWSFQNLSKKTSKNQRCRVVGSVLLREIERLRGYLRSISTNRCLFVPPESQKYCGITHCGACEARMAIGIKKIGEF